MADDEQFPSQTAASGLAFNREDFAVLAADFQRRMRGRSDNLGALAVIVSLAIGLGLMSVATARGWPDFMQPIFFFFGWSLVLIPVGMWRIRQRRLLGALGLLCAGCGKPLVNTFANRSRGETVLVTGVCPSCNHMVFPLGAD